MLTRAWMRSLPLVWRLSQAWSDDDKHAIAGELWETVSGGGGGGGGGGGCVGVYIAYVHPLQTHGRWSDLAYILDHLQEQQHQEQQQQEQQPHNIDVGAAVKVSCQRVVDGAVAALLGALDLPGVPDNVSSMHTPTVGSCASRAESAALWHALEVITGQNPDLVGTAQCSTVK